MHIEWKRKAMIVGIAVTVYVGYRWLLPAAAPFLAAWFLAVWLYPVTVKIEKRTKIKKGFAGAVLLAGLFGFLGFLLYLGAVEIFAQVKTAIARLPVLLRWVRLLTENCCSMLEGVTGIPAAKSQAYLVSHMEGMRQEFLSAVSPGTAAKLFAGVKGLLVLISGVVVAFICTLLMMGDMENIQKRIWDYSWLVGIRRVVRRLKSTTITYLKAQAVLIVVMAAVCTAGFWIMKSPYFLILGIFLGVLDALPLFGTGAFLYPAALVCLLRGKNAVAAGCVILDLVTSVLREFLEPKLLGGKLGIPPIAVLFSVYAGVFLFGGWGVLLGPLAFSTCYEIGKEWDVWG